MKVARINVVAIRLVCPHCQQTITAKDGTQVIHADVSERWTDIASHKQVCKCCNKTYWLPANPFPKE